MSKRAESREPAASQRENRRKGENNYVCWSIHSDSGSGDFAALMLMIIKLKVHPVMALFTTALLTGIALGYGVTGSVDYISNGFGGTLGSVGITIILAPSFPWPLKIPAQQNPLPTSSSSCSGAKHGAGSCADCLHHVHPCFRGHHHGADCPLPLCCPSGSTSPCLRWLHSLAWACF